MQNHAREGGQKVSRFVFFMVNNQPEASGFLISRYGEAGNLARIIALRTQVRVLLPQQKGLIAQFG